MHVKALNEEIVTQKYRSRELYSAARRLSRDSSFSEDQSAVDELDSLRTKTDDLAKCSSEQLSLLEQTQPLVDLFWQTRENLLVFFDQFEKEIKVELLPPAEDLGQIKLLQDTIQVNWTPQLHFLNGVLRFCFVKTLFCLQAAKMLLLFLLLA